MTHSQLHRDRAVHILSGTALAIAAFALLGSWLGFVSWTRWLPDLPRMVPTTGLSLASLAIGVSLGAPARAGSASCRRASLAAAALTLLVAGAALAAYAVHSPLGLENFFLFDRTEVGAAYRGRMSPQTAGALSCLALSLALSVTSAPRPRVAQLLGTVTAILAALALGGQLHGVVRLFGVSDVVGVSLPTAVALLALAAALAALHRDFGLRMMLTRGGPAGRYARQMLLGSVAIPFGAAVALRVGELRGWYDASFRSGAYVAVMVVLLCGAAWVATLAFLGTEEDRAKLVAERAAREALETVSRELRQQVEERERAERAVREREERLAVTLRSIGDAVIATDEMARVSLLNRVAEGLTGWTFEEAAGRPLAEVFDIIDEETRRSALNPVERVLREGIVLGLANHTALVARDGTERPIADSAAPIRDAEGRIAGAVLVFRDQTEERRAERALRESEQRFRLALRNAPVSVAVQDRDLRYVWAYNQRLAAPEEIIGKRDEEIFTAAEAARLTAIKRRVLDEDVDHREQMWLDRPGGPIFLDAYFEPIRDAQGQVVGVGSATVDLTRMKLAEDAALRSEAEACARAVQLQAVLDCIPDGVLVYDREGRIVRSTPAADRMLQLPAGERQARVVERVARQYEIFTEDGRRVEPEEMVAVRAAVHGETLTGQIQQVRSGRAEPRWLMLSATPLLVEGVQSGAVISMTDLTERKRTEQELAIATRLYAVLSHVNEAIVRTRDEQALFEDVCRIVAEDGGFPLVWVGLVRGREIARAACWGAAADYLTGARVEIDGELGRGPTGTAVREGRPVVNDDFEVNPATWPWREATARHGLRASAALPLRRGGKVIGALTFYAARAGAFTPKQVSLLEALCADLSYALDSFQLERLRAEAEQALRDSERRLREADRRKDEFLGMLSHELRNPLAPIRNSVFVLSRAEAGSEQARRARSVIERQAAHLTRLVDDLLDVTRVARGKIELRREKLDLGDLVRSTAEDFRAVVEERGVALHLAIPDAKIIVDGDAVRLAQIVGNLLHNSAKFTQSGADVTLTVTSAEGAAEVRVRDTGEGIDPALLPQVFDSFVQGEQPLARSHGGLGLGLALVKGLTELHGGSVRAESAGVGQGAEFRVRLPLAQPEAAPIERPPRPAPHGIERRRVLVVDDNTDGANALADIVALLGHVVEVAYDGPSAVEKARAARPDVVFCDIGLPGMSGYEVARALRAGEARAARLVALTGYAQPEDVKRAAQAGFDVHLAKPCDPEDIKRLLDPGIGDSDRAP